MTPDPSPIVRNFQPLVTEHDAHMTGSWALTYAIRILADHQAHIDALVEAGVLRKCSDNENGAYTVVVPHTHTWRVIDLMPADQLGRCRIACSCTESHVIPNHLPIDIPG